MHAGVKCARGAGEFFRVCLPRPLALSQGARVLVGRVSGAGRPWCAGLMCACDWGAAAASAAATAHPPASLTAQQLPVLSYRSGQPRVQLVHATANRRHSCVCVCPGAIDALGRCVWPLCSCNVCGVRLPPSAWPAARAGVQGVSVKAQASCAACVARKNRPSERGCCFWVVWPAAHAC